MKNDTQKRVCEKATLFRWSIRIGAKNPLVLLERASIKRMHEISNSSIGNRISIIKKLLVFISKVKWLIKTLWDCLTSNNCIQTSVGNISYVMRLEINEKVMAWNSNN